MVKSLDFNGFTLAKGSDSGGYVNEMKVTINMLPGTGKLVEQHQQIRW